MNDDPQPNDQYWIQVNEFLGHIRTNVSKETLEKVTIIIDCGYALITGTYENVMKVAGEGMLTISNEGMGKPDLDDDEEEDDEEDDEDDYDYNTDRSDYFLNEN